MPTKNRRSVSRRMTQVWRHVARTVPEWCDECVMFLGMMSWAIGRLIPIEFSWCSAAIASPRFA